MRVWNVLLARHFKNNKYDKPQLLSPHAVTTEAHVPRACALQRSPHTTLKKKKMSGYEQTIHKGNVVQM